MSEWQEYINRVEELGQDILFSLRTNFPVNVFNEQELCALLDGENVLEIATQVPAIRELIEHFLDNGDGEAWNLANLLVGAPV